MKLFITCSKESTLEESQTDRHPDLCSVTSDTSDASESSWGRHSWWLEPCWWWWWRGLGQGDSSAKVTCMSTCDTESFSVTLSLSDREIPWQLSSSFSGSSSSVLDSVSVSDHSLLCIPGKLNREPDRNDLVMASLLILLRFSADLVNLFVLFLLMNAPLTWCDTLLYHLSLWPCLIMMAAAEDSTLSSSDDIVKSWTETMRAMSWWPVKSSYKGTGMSSIREPLEINWVSDPMLHII